VLELFLIKSNFIKSLNLSNLLTFATSLKATHVEITTIAHPTED